MAQGAGKVGKEASSLYDTLRTNEYLWDYFTKKEEYPDQSPVLDKYGRFLSSSSRYKNSLDPAVSRFLMEQGYSASYQDGRRFALCLTHDIDQIVSNTVSGGIRVLRIPSSPARMVTSIGKKAMPRNNFGKIMDIEEKYGGRSSFFFLAPDASERNPPYSFEELKNEMDEIITRGWEIGLHGGLDAFNDASKMKAEKERLEKAVGRKVSGYRNHFLRMSIPDTWKKLSEVGFKYDTTFGYPDGFGFRNGMCHPFEPVDLTTGERIGLLEIPLAVMDRTIRSYQKKNPSDSFSSIKELIDVTEKHGGVLTILWHNTFMSGGMLKLFEKILAYSREKNAWITSADDIRLFWEKNGLKKRPIT